MRRYYATVLRPTVHIEDTNLAALSIDPASGALRIGGLTATISAGQKKADIEPLLEPFARGVRDYGNGYEWLNFGGISFGGYPCGLALCFFEDRLVEASWSVALPDAPMEGGWPTRKAIDDEVRFVQKVLTEQLGQPPHAAAFGWGKVWSAFDSKGFLAANGIRYAQNPQRH
jgi:hypothetical protein